MKSIKELYEMALELFDAKTDFVFATIIESSGSAPRKAGAKMLVLPNGKTYGTIGGGNIEYTAAKDALVALDEKKTFTKTYDLSNSQAGALGMICGGRVTVEFEYISHEDPRSVEFREYFRNNARSSGDTVYIFGGGHVAQALVPILKNLNFSCIVFDDRPEFANETIFPGASKCIIGNFEEVEQYLRIQPGDFICIMTRGHLCDYAVQKQILGTSARYIGVMGSRKKTETIRQKLLADGFSERDIERCKSPIGLDINAETPEEIAISIAGELIRIRNQK